MKNNGLKVYAVKLNGEKIEMGVFATQKQVETVRQGLEACGLYKALEVYHKEVVEFGPVKEETVASVCADHGINITPKKEQKVYKSFKEMALDEGVKKLTVAQQCEILKLKKTNTVDGKTFFIREDKLNYAKTFYAGDEKGAFMYLDAAIEKLAAKTPVSK